MAHLRLLLRDLTLFEDEEWGDTHMAMYANVVDAGGALLSSFQWNNVGQKVDEVNTYSLANDRANPNVLDFDANGPITISVDGYADDDNSWPNPSSNENHLGSAAVTVDPNQPATLGSFTVGPTTTDNGNTGFLVDATVASVAPPASADLRIQLHNLVLYEDEEAGDTHIAITVFVDAAATAAGPSVSADIFEWNNAGQKVDEVNTYDLNNGQVLATQRITVPGPARISVQGYADDDQNWPHAGAYENYLGGAVIFVDPSDPTTLGQRQLGPTTTDNGNTGYVINLSVEVLPPNTPTLAVTGVEVTQAIQHYNSVLGPANSVPLVANKMTLVRVYVDSGLDPGSPSGGLVGGVTGTLVVGGDGVTAINPLQPLTARPISQVNPQKFTDTLNFYIPDHLAHGVVSLTAQVSGGGSNSVPFNVPPIVFTPTGRVNILIFRVQSGPVSGEDSSGGPPSRATYFTNLNRLPLCYPIATNPATSMQYWYVPGAEVIYNTHDLRTDDGMDDLLGDLEDIQEDGPNWIKGYWMVQDNLMARFGKSRKWDNVAIGYRFIMESISHELGHLYGLDHAPCGGPDNPDSDFVPQTGLVGEVGVDVIGQVAFSPAVSDFMSYCGDGGATFYENQWISAYHWTKLFREFA